MDWTRKGFIEWIQFHDQQEPAGQSGLSDQCPYAHYLQEACGCDSDTSRVCVGETQTFYEDKQQKMRKKNHTPWLSAFLCRLDRGRMAGAVVTFGDVMNALEE